MARTKLIAGNWKMNKDREGARALAADIVAGLGRDLDAEVGLFPPAPFLADVVDAVRGAAPRPVHVGAQNAHFEASGAFTGEVSVGMIRSTGARWVILGHSERRHVFGETDELVGKKVRAALDGELTPILCVGETIEEREADRTDEVVLRQLRAGLDGLSADHIGAVVIAYEPVWAIGTGKTATPQQGEEVHRTIRSEIEKLAGAPVAASVRILYGGSVKPENVKALLSEPDIDGALVGGASLDAGSFLKICDWKT